MEKINYQETFSHVVKMITINAVISLAAAEGWTLHQMNVYNAFLQGYTQSHLDYSLLTKRSCNKLVVILVCVNDFLITGNNIELINAINMILQNSFKIKDLGELMYFMGIEFAMSSEGILMHQRKYSMELISSIGLEVARPLGAPVDLNQKLTSSEFDSYAFCDADWAFCPNTKKSTIRYFKSGDSLILRGPRSRKT
uniref:Uncharacterized protein LOC104245180 n=1 Tax=Nicotiana sylvestris TaxID=4096 RepID=A0A1U7Y7G0_NICSY|nr:PREDICTED: uncharacterized protein LOC104245180 [Nicotiana sylvestris]